MYVLMGQGRPIWEVLEFQSLYSSVVKGDLNTNKNQQCQDCLLERDPIDLWGVSLPPITLIYR